MARCRSAPWPLIGGRVRHGLSDYILNQGHLKDKNSVDIRSAILLWLLTKRTIESSPDHDRQKRRTPVQDKAGVIRQRIIPGKLHDAMILPAEEPL